MSISEHLLKRPVIENLIKKAIEKPLTTVIAGAGFGKTQAVLAALKSTDCKSIWIQLSQLDNHCFRFWERLAYSFKLHSHSLFESLISLGYPESIVAFDQFLRLLVRYLRQEEPFILIFDDFHLINNKSLLNFIELLVSANMNNFSIVLISRKKPDLSLTSMLFKGILTQITDDVLRFSKDEMNAYFDKQGLSLSKSDSAGIFSYTDGWIFAICLISSAIKKGKSIRAAQIDIFDLIEKEIFQAASKELQHFLLKVSALEFIPSSFIKELTDDHLSIISEMNQIGHFIRYDSSSDCYRIHHLFKEYLMERQSRLDKSDLIEIHLKAAKWHKKNNQRLEAIVHYKKCGLYHEIFDIILTFTYYVAQETADLFIELIQQAPAEILRERPVMRIAMANFMLNNNRIADAKQQLLKIQKDEEDAAILGETYIILALISILNVDFQFVDLFKKADEYLPCGSKLIDAKLNIAEGLNVCSIKNSAPGELKRHQNAMFEAAPYASRVMNGCGYGLEYLNAAEYSLYTGELKEAKQYAFEAIHLSRQYHQYDIEYMAQFVLVRIFAAKGNYSEITNILERMRTRLETLKIPECISFYDIIRSWFYLKIGRPDKVAKWIKYEEEARKMLVPVILGREYLVRSDCLLAEERYDELLAYMKQTDKLYNDRGILFAVIQNKITKAIIYHYTGNHTESLTMLTEAYELTHPNGLTIQYIEYGNKMRTLIHAIRQNGDCKIPKDWLDKIYTKSSTYAKQLTQVVSAYNATLTLENPASGLSKREFEVLTYLYRGMARKEIADSCYLSTGTIDGILKNIYTKLGVTKSVEAVRIAIENNFL